MSTEIEISIIIPMYNIEKYIAICLESVISQSGLSMEVLVVDDKSTDNSKKIVNAYTQKYPFIKLIDNKKTKGISGARNTAMEIMKGKFCFFLDGDDLVAPNSLKPFVSFMKEHNASLIRGKLTHFCHQRWIYTADPVFHDISKNNYPTGSFAQFLYSTAFLKENKLFFPEEVYAIEDKPFFSKVFSLVDQIPFFEQNVYIYRINHKKVAYVSAKYVISFVQHFKYIENSLKKFNKLHYYPSYLRAQFSYDCLRNTYYTLQESNESAKEYMDTCAQILHDKEEILSTPLKQWLQDKSGLFWKACKERDSSAMLEILQSTDILVPHTTYSGIKEEQVQKNWKFLRFLHRVKNTLTYPSSYKNLWYIFSLIIKSKKLLRSKQVTTV